MRVDVAHCEALLTFRDITPRPHPTIPRQRSGAQIQFSPPAGLLVAPVTCHSLLLPCFTCVRSPAVSLPELPPKKLKLFQSHNSPAFIEKRAVLLTNYLRKLLDNKRLVNSKLVHDFFASDRFTDPTLTSHSNTNSTAHTTASPVASNGTAASDSPLPTSSSFTSSSAGSAASTAPSSPVDSSPLLSSSPNTPPTSSINFRLPADSEITTLSIPTHRLVNGTVLYAIHCHSQHRPAPLAHWTQLKRFSQLVQMDERLRSSLFPHCDEPERRRRLDAIPERPAKRVSLGSSGSGEDRGFIEERRVLMEHYLRSLLLNEECRKNRHLLEFLGVEG